MIDKTSWKIRNRLEQIQNREKIVINTKILKTICDINIFEDETMTSEKMQKKLDEAEDYCYQLPIYRNGKTYVYTVGKGGPVREDIREYVKKD